MRAILCALTAMVFLCVPAYARGMEVTVEITGPQELSALKEGIAKTITARCITQGVPMEKYSRLSVSISKLGDVISYDALLDTAPPRAFHKDIKDASALSGTIDEMIKEILVGTGTGQAVPTPAPGQAPKAELGPRTKLPFLPTSIAAVGERIFVSDAKMVYEISEGKASQVWTVRGNNEIMRISPYGDSLIVLAKLQDGFRTFLIKDGETKDSWNKAVIPLGPGLVSSTLRFDRIFGPPFYQWTRSSLEAGSSPLIPQGLDIASTIAADVMPSAGGVELISYDSSDRLTISNGKETLWTDVDATSITPQYIDEERRSGSNFEGYSPARYYLKPRIVTLGERIVTFRNDQGLAKMMSRLNLFNSSQILVYAPSPDGFSREVLTAFANGYCVDITVVQGKPAALIVQDKSAYVQYIGL